MILKHISILNYKNIGEAELDLSSKMNCFLGNNGQGKTNLLDAVYYLSFCKSFANSVDSQNIRHDADFFMIQGFYEHEDGTPEEIYCGMKRKFKKQFKRNKKEYKRLSEHIGLLPLVMISPADTELIQGGSEERRRFMDLIISQQDKNYLHALIQYNKALLQRNTLLKEQSHDTSLFDVLEMQLAMYGEQIFSKRKQLIEKLVPLFNQFHQQICHSAESVDLTYISQLVLIGYTTAGIHKDELEMLLDGSLIRRVGSQGQQKTYLIALKLAQYSLLAQEGASTPLLLLDDIFDKLDAERVAQIIHLVGEEQFGQIFITDTNRKYLDKILETINSDFALFEVEQGCIKPLKEA